MAGTITVFDNQARKNILGELAALKRRFLSEVIVGRFRCSWKETT